MRDRDLVAPVVLTLGTFDLPHPGHVALFRECRKLAGPDGRVVVAVNRDGFVARFKHQAPLMMWSERCEVIRAIRYVDEVLENTGNNQPDLIDSVRPDWLAIGVDWATRDYYGQLGITPEWLAERRISLVYLAHEHSTAVSTTKLRDRLMAGKPSG
jgi:glycerol-3-phosphate cytidylyltransferase